MGTTPQPANTPLFQAILEGVDAWNKWRLKNTNLPAFDLTGADLRRRDLTGADLRGVDLSYASLQGTKLGRGTRLRNAHIVGANLSTATLCGADLRNADFSKAALCEADLRGANLQEAIFSDANLQKANLRGTDLQKVTFHNTNLYQADLRESNLQGADLSTAQGGLLSRQFAGADLTGAKLPEPLTKLYDGLSSVKEISDSAQKLFLALLAGCLYSWLTIAQTTDVELITNRATTPLPIIQAAIPIVGFYVVAPLILLCLYFYFHFYLQKLWEELGSLPAIFPDGRELHKRTDPWLLNDLVRSHYIKLKDGRPFLSYFQAWISVALAWWLVPVTLFMFWLRFLRRHDLFWTIVHALLLAIAIFSAVRLYSIANQTLRGDARTIFRWKDLPKRRSTYLQISFAAVLGALIITMSFGVILGEPYWPPDSVHIGYRITSPGTWMPWLLDQAGYYPFANLKNADVSVKPANWTGKKEEEELEVKGASLAQTDLRNADAAGGFFVMANLDSAHMEGAHLLGASLRRANLSNANLRRANLYHSDLDYADLSQADLRWAQLSSAKLSNARLFLTDLSQANLDDADLGDADLSYANLTGTYLRSANLTRASLQGAHLKYADFRMSFVEMLFSHSPYEKKDEDPLNKYLSKHYLRFPLGSGSHGLTPEMLATAEDWQLAFYDRDVLKQLGLPPDHNEKLQKQMEAELKQAKSGGTALAAPK